MKVHVSSKLKVHNPSQLCNTAQGKAHLSTCWQVQSARLHLYKPAVIIASHHAVKNMMLGLHFMPDAMGGLQA